MDKYEIVVVNDRSTDNTYEIIKNFQMSWWKASWNASHADWLSTSQEQAQNSSEGNDEPPLSVVLVNIVTLPAGMVGKQNAVKQGLAVCKGDIILNTDADCIAPPSWISRMVDSFDELSELRSNELRSTGFVAGIVVNFEKGKKAPLFAKLQSLDLIYLMNFAIGCLGWGKPISCIGNNIAYRKQALEDVGGYDSLGKHRTGHSSFGIAAVGALAAPVAGSIIGFTTDIATGELQKGKPSWTAFGAIAGALMTPITSTIAYHLADFDESDKEFVMSLLSVRF